MTFLEFMDVCKTANRFSALPGLIFFVLYYKKMGKTISVVYLILLVSFLADSLNYIFIWIYEYHRVNTNFNSYLISNLWIVLDFYLVSWLFIRLVPAKKKIAGLFISIFTVVAILSFCCNYSFFESNTLTKTSWSISLIIYSILSFSEILKYGTIERLSRFPIFWVLTGIFLFSSALLFKYLTQQYLVFELEVAWEEYARISFFTLLFNIMKNLLFFLAFILVQKGYPDYIFEGNNSPTSEAT